jgi:hypothetical protein
MTIKTATDNLAIFGAAAAFAQPLHVGRPNFGDCERFSKYVNMILDNRWAFGLKGEVIVQSFTFVAAAHALQWLGIAPIFCDIYQLTLLHQTEKVAERIMILPTGSTVGEHEIEIIGNILRPAIDNAYEVHQRIAVKG